MTRKLSPLAALATVRPDRRGLFGRTRRERQRRQRESRPGAGDEVRRVHAEAWSGGIASAVVIGAFAGLMPAVRASRMPPTVALRTV
jgi:hypothetical protein